MSDETSGADGKNSLLGEFLVALVRAPESVQEAVMIHALKQMRPFRKSLIDPYPMLQHLSEIMDRRGKE